MNEIICEKVSVLMLDQGDLRIAIFAIANLADDETDEEKKAALKRVEGALWEITNHCGAEAIASGAVLGTYIREAS